MTHVNTASIKNASSIVAKGVLAYYSGSNPGQDVGVFGAPYYWWQAGAVWASLIDYWNYTGDGEYVGLVQQALLSQVGPSNNYVPPNQTKTEVGSPPFSSCKVCQRLALIAKYRQTMIKPSGAWRP